MAIVFYLIHRLDFSTNLKQDLLFVDFVLSCGYFGNEGFLDPTN